MPQSTRLQKSITTSNADGDHVVLFWGIAFFRLANDQISVPFATERTPNFRNETTTFLEKGPHLSLPKDHARTGQALEGEKWDYAAYRAVWRFLGRSSQGPAECPEIAKNCHFRAQKTSRIWRDTGIFVRKCGICLIRGLQFFCTSWLIPKVAAPKGELQSPDEEKTTFSQKYPDFSSNSTRFLGSKVAIFFRGKVRKIFAGSWRKIEIPKKFSGFFREERATFDPKKRVEFKENLGFFSKNVALFSSGVDNSPVGTTTSGICRLL